MSEEVLRLCDLAAESLVLCDVGDPASIAELVERLADIAGALEAEDTHPAALALSLARDMSAGDTQALGAVEAAFSQARSELLEQLSASRAADRAESAQGSVKPKRKSRPAARPARNSGGAPPVVEQQSPGAMPLAGDAELMNDFVVRALEHLDDADARLLDLEQAPADKESVDAVFRAFHTIKGMAGFLALDRISERAHDFESLLAAPRAEGTPLDEDCRESLFSAVDEMRGLVAACITDCPEASDQPVSVEGSGQASGAPVPGRNGDAASAVREGTVRVAEARLDVLLDTIGELVIAESMATASVREDADAAVVAGRLERLDKITRELQHMATSLRMVPLKATFGRMARLVRDLSHKSGKPITFITSGEETELDKAVVDRIQDPLIHALRNAVDHGVETVEERIANGKPREATIELKAYHAGGSIHIEVSDDGRGIDRDAVLAKARHAGLIGEDEDPTDEKLTSVLFAPGFSTASEVTDVSGRGVGMDVVRRTVEELRGRIDMATSPRAGTTMSVRLPVTLAIIDGMVCRIAHERYIIPVLSIERSIRPTPEQVSTVIEHGLMLVADDGLLPIVRLHDLLGVPGAQKDPTNAVVVIVSEGGLRAGLLVCELLGQQQTVIKPLGDGLPDQPGIAGGAVMPDGRVGLILDAAGLVRIAHGREG